MGAAWGCLDLVNRGRTVGKQRKNEIMKTRIQLLLLALLGLVLTPAAQAYYNSSTGRWLTRDPIGEQGGRNVYAVVDNNPAARVDALGLSTYIPRSSKPKPKCGTCGPEIGPELLKALGKVEREFGQLDDEGKRNACSKSYLLGHWDLNFPPAPEGCGTGDCAGTVSVGGRCYHGSVVNYVMFGRIAKLCGMYRSTMQSMILGNKTILKPLWQTVSDEPYEWQYTDDVTGFANLGYDKDLKGELPPSSHGYGDCKKCTKRPPSKRLKIGTDWP